MNSFNYYKKKQWEIKAELKEKKGELAQDRQDRLIDLLLNKRGIGSEKEKKDFIKPVLPQEIEVSNLGFLKTELKKAFNRIKKALEDNETIIIYGDYDADGICATAVMWQTLNSLGFKTLPFIPHREIHGYALKKSGIEEIIKDEKILSFNNKKKISLIITVDNGIVANSAVDFSNKKGIDVIITDHHQKKENDLPKALAIIWSDKICGAAVAWFFCLQLFTFIKKEKLVGQTKLGAAEKLLFHDLLGLTAIATITDLMPLLSFNRSIIKHGLEILKKTTNVGLLALYQQAGLKIDNLDTYSLGFLIGPRLNATGRLSHSLDSLRLLCTQDSFRAEKLAALLDKTNKDRKQLTDEVFSHAAQKAKLQLSQKFIIVGDQSYNPGVIGLVASKLVETFYRPAIVLFYGEIYSKASARSVKNFNIIEALRKASHLFEDVGGHPMAAGFTIENKKIVRFSKIFSRLTDRIISQQMLVPTITIDCQINLKDINWQLSNQIEKFAPFGIGNPTPTFLIKGLQVKSLRTVGNGNKHLKLTLDDPETKKIEKTAAQFDSIGFNLGNLIKQIKVGDKVDVVFNLEKNIWNGRQSLQLKLKDLKPSSAPGSDTRGRSGKA